MTHGTHSHVYSEFMTLLLYIYIYIYIGASQLLVHFLHESYPMCSSLMDPCPYPLVVHSEPHYSGDGAFHL